jgi:DNA transformation protein
MTGNGTPMSPKRDEFQKLIEYQLESIPGLAFRRMFGGFGIYSGEIFFGIIHAGRLYFHVNENTRARYENCDMTYFTAPGGKKALKYYYEVPLSAIESGIELVEWAREAIASAA